MTVVHCPYAVQEHTPGRTSDLGLGRVSGPSRARCPISKSPTVRAPLVTKPAMPLPVEKSQGSVSSLISRFQNAADANERRKAQESQPRPAGRLSVGGNGPVAAAKKAVETVKEVVVGEPKDGKPDEEAGAGVSKAEEATAAKEPVKTLPVETEEAQLVEVDELPEKHAATEEKLETPVDEPVKKDTEEIKRPSIEASEMVEEPTAAANVTPNPTYVPAPAAPESPSIKPIPQSPPKTKSPPAKASTPSSIPRAARTSSASLTPQRTGTTRARPSNGTETLKPQVTGSSVSPLKPQITGTPTRPTAASLARAKESQERRAAAEAKNVTLPKAAASRRSVTPGKSAIPAPSPASRERKVSATSSSGSSIPRAVRRVSGTASPSPAPASVKQSTPSSERRTASTPSSSLMRGTASSRLKAASASPSPTQVKPKASSHIVAKTKKPEGVVPIDPSRVSAEPEFRVGLPGARANQASADV